MEIAIAKVDKENFNFFFMRDPNYENNTFNTN